MIDSNQIQSDYGAKIETLFKVEPPFQKVEKGFGYKGVVLLDTIMDKSERPGRFKSFFRRIGF